MSLAWNGQEIAGLALNGSAVSACYNGEIVWPVGGGGGLAVCLVGDATATAYATAYDGGNVYTSWSTNSSAVEYVPMGATLFVRTETPNYYRHSGISSNCSGFTSGVNSGFGRSLTGSGYVTEDATASVNGTNTNKFTATGGFQSCGSNSGAKRPHTLAYLNTTYSFAKSGISGKFTSQGAYGSALKTATLFTYDPSWISTSLVAANRLLTGVPFSSFSAYVSSYGRFAKVNQSKTVHCSAGVVVQTEKYEQTGSYLATNGPYGLSKTSNYTASTYQSTTYVDEQIAMHAIVNWNGVASTLSTNGKWSATGIAP